MGKKYRDLLELRQFYVGVLNQAAVSAEFTVQRYFACI